MQLELIVNAFWSTVGVLALLAFYFVIFEPMMAEAFRERLAGIRERLDAHGHRNQLFAGARAVTRLRTIIDGLSTSAEHVTLVRVVLATALIARHPVEPSPSFAELLNEMPADARAHLERVHEEIQLELIRHVCKNSPLGWLLVAVTFPIYAAQVGISLLRNYDRVFQRMLTTFTGLFSGIERQAEIAGACCAPA